MEDVKKIDLLSLFPPSEALAGLYYGRIGQGKTYALVADIIQALKSGQVVYSNFPLNWDYFDQRKDIWALLAGLIGFKKDYYKFLATNLHYLPVDKDFHEKLGSLTDCIVAIDEGYVAFDSYEMAKMSMQKRQNILHTRHFNRAIWITAQRPTSVHVQYRAQVNAFYKCTKVLTWPVVLFKKEEFDLSSDEKVDELNCYSRKWYIGKKAVFNAFDSKYLRGDTPNSQDLHIEIYHLTLKEAFNNFFIKTIGFFRLKTKKAESLGVKVPFATIKSSRGLNTATGGRQDELPF